jgi:hypothetical protein
MRFDCHKKHKETRKEISLWLLVFFVATFTDDLCRPLQLGDP